MAQTKIENHTDFAHQVLFSQNENMYPIVAPILKSTLDIGRGGEITVAKKQLPVNLGGSYNGEPESASYMYEPEGTYFKPEIDVAFIADAISPEAFVDSLPVVLRVGGREKRFRVFGDRYWLRNNVLYEPSPPKPFQVLPMIYENAFGGWDTRHSDSLNHGFEARNTVGKGYFCKKGGALRDSKLVLPNIEYEAQLIKDITDQPEPAGCGFTLPHWQPRARFAGTYDEQWQKTRSPLLPKDFDARFYNAASSGFVFDTSLLEPSENGVPDVYAENVTPQGVIQFNLPRVRPIACDVEMKSHTESLPLKLDTIIINLREMKLIYIWRNHLLLVRGPHDCERVVYHYG